MSNCMIVFFTTECKGLIFKDDVTGATCSTYGKEKNSYKTLPENVKSM
jgi:hypothetical protein